MKKIVFIISLTATMFASADGAKLYSNDGKFLGNVNNNPYDSNSISNPYGKYGSKYSADSINNPYGTYGNKYSNEYTPNPYGN